MTGDVGGVSMSPTNGLLLGDKSKVTMHGGHISVPIGIASHGLFTIAGRGKVFRCKDELERMLPHMDGRPVYIADDHPDIKDLRAWAGLSYVHPTHPVRGFISDSHLAQRGGKTVLDGMANLYFAEEMDRLGIGPAAGGNSDGPGRDELDQDLDDIEARRLKHNSLGFFTNYVEEPGEYEGEEFTLRERFTMPTHVQILRKALPACAPPQCQLLPGGMSLTAGGLYVMGDADSSCPPGDEPNGDDQDERPTSQEQGEIPMTDPKPPQEGEGDGTVLVKSDGTKHMEIKDVSMDTLTEVHPGAHSMKKANDEMTDELKELTGKLETATKEAEEGKKAMETLDGIRAEKRTVAIAALLMAMGAEKFATVYGEEMSDDVTDDELTRTLQGLTPEEEVPAEDAAEGAGGHSEPGPAEGGVYTGLKVKKAGQHTPPGAAAPAKQMESFGTLYRPPVAPGSGGNA